MFDSRAGIAGAGHQDCCTGMVAHDYGVVDARVSYDGIMIVIVYTLDDG